MRRKIILTAILAVFVLSPQAFAQQKGPQAVPVVASRAVEREARAEVTLVGTVTPFRVSEVAAQREGLVEQYEASEGRFVERGGLLARLDRTTTAIKLKGARAKLEEARAMLEKAERDFKRTKVLYEKKTVPEKSYTDDLYAFESQKHRVKALEEDVAWYEDRLAKTEVKSPFTGFISKEHTQVGEWVNTGSPICRLVEIDRVKIEAEVPERYVVGLEEGAHARVSVGAMPGRSFSGRLDAISPAGDPDARTFTLLVVMDNKDRKILPGMLVRVSLPTSEKKTGVFVPKDALVAQGPETFVYVVREGKAFPVPVQKGRPLNDLMEVMGPIQPGTTVVVRGNERLRPGQQVNVTKTR